MRRFFPLLTAILVGALATGIGMTIFLKKANSDRERLAGIAQQTQEESKIAQEKSQKIVEDANKKLEDANAEIAKAQQAVKDLQEERDLIARAAPLTAPNPKLTKGWKEIVDLPLGITFKAPPTSRVETNDAASFSLATESEKWFSVTPYDERLESELLAEIATSTRVTYVVDGHLVVGWQGKAENQFGSTYLLHVRKDGRNSHLIWARTPTGTSGPQTLTAALASISFAQ